MSMFENLVFRTNEGFIQMTNYFVYMEFLFLEITDIYETIE